MAAMIAFKTISNQLNYTTSLNKNEKPPMPNALHQNIQLTNNGSKFSIADILGFSSIEAMASSFASSTPTSGLLSNAKQSLMHNSNANNDFNVKDYNRINENNSFNDKKRLQSHISNASGLSNVNFQHINNLININKSSDLHSERLQTNRNSQSKFHNSDSCTNNSFNQLIATNQFLKNDKVNDYRQQNISLQNRKSSNSLINQNLSAIKYNRLGNLSDEKIEENSERGSEKELPREYDSDDDDDEDDNGNSEFMDDSIYNLI
jgi:hypothetical protein